jgi:hypothetical protein
MDTWLQLTSLGNQLYNDRQFELAKKRYLSALERAQLLLNTYEVNERRISYWVISYQNLADCELQLNNPQASGQLLMQCHQQIRRLINETPFQASIYSAYLKGLNEVTQSLSLLISNYPEVQICNKCLKQVFGRVPITYNSN